MIREIIYYKRKNVMVHSPNPRWVGFHCLPMSTPDIVKPKIRHRVSILQQQHKENQCCLLSLSLQLFHSCCPALLDSRRLLGGSAHRPVSQTWRGGDGRRRLQVRGLGSSSPRFQPPGCHLLLWLKSFALSCQVAVIIQAHSHEALLKMTVLFDLEKCLINS